MQSPPNSYYLLCPQAYFVCPPHPLHKLCAHTPPTALCAHTPPTACNVCPPSHSIFVNDTTLCIFILPTPPIAYFVCPPQSLHILCAHTTDHPHHIMWAHPTPCILYCVRTLGDTDITSDNRTASQISWFSTRFSNPCPTPIGYKILELQ